MGQYHFVVNLDKGEYLHPHRLGDGLKLREFGQSAGGTMFGLAILLAVSNGRGGGDLLYEGPLAGLIGSWGGDRIAIVGDYQEPGDLPPEFDDIWDQIDQGKIKDISAAVRELIEAGGVYSFPNPDAPGWIQRRSRFDEQPAVATPDMVIGR